MIVAGLVGLLLLYAVVGWVRRWLAKPDFTGKTVWITGASSGIGEQLAYEFNRLGARLILTARNFK
jgi:NADPH:quinone reductase-like Zn-dependent oxidoreductase